MRETNVNYLELPVRKTFTVLNFDSLPEYWEPGLNFLVKAFALSQFCIGSFQNMINFIIPLKYIFSGKIFFNRPKVLIKF